MSVEGICLQTPFISPLQTPFSTSNKGNEDNEGNKPLQTPFSKSNEDNEVNEVTEDTGDHEDTGDTEDTEDNDGNEDNEGNEDNYEWGLEWGLEWGCEWCWRGLEQRLGKTCFKP